MDAERRTQESLVLAALIATVSNFAFSANNYPIQAPYPSIIYVRSDCGSMQNCGNSLLDAKNWVDSYKNPDQSNPLLIEIGPGTFNKYFSCNNHSNITIKGSGVGTTILTGGTQLGAAIRGSNCYNFSVQDLEIKTELGSAIIWNGEGSSNWTNVKASNAGIYAWTESEGAGCPTNQAVHRWFSSTLTGTTKTYEARCSDNWFFGSQLSVISTSGNAKVIVAQSLSGQPKFHIYGSNITVKADEGYDASPLDSSGNGIMAVESSSNGEVHIHGTGIDVFGNGSSNTIAALVSTGGHIHADQTAYNLTGNGNPVARLVNFYSNHHIHAPYLWPAHDTPPAITSITGADTAVLLDQNTGLPSLIIYNSACSNKWSYVVSGSCI